MVTSYYWSSSSYVYDPAYAWYVSVSVGYVYYNARTSTYYVWPVRGGQ